MNIQELSGVWADLFDWMKRDGPTWIEEADSELETYAAGLDDA